MSTALLFLAVAVAAPEAKIPLKNDNPFAGTWELVECMTVGGTPSYTLGGTVTFGADGSYKAALTQRGEPRPSAGTYKYDAKKTPQELDFIQPAAAGTPARTSLAIYRIDGNTLTILGNPVGDRPAAFDGPAAAGKVLMVFKLVKDR